ncbi:MAG TPA: hypothetical protein VNH83_08200 [Bryobacteraceae bacterium]|nr:hypothetical protein [Bryobacteraceae bacterium]
MLKYLALLLLFAGAAHAVNGPCPQTNGPITARAIATRASGISPLLVFYDATGTTYSGTLGGANTAFQDLSYTWNFGDTLTSGTSTWLYGSRPSVNKRNTATGAIAAHLYITEGRDTKYTATVTVTDGTTTVSCGVGTTAFDPSGANGFPGAATTCYFNSTVGSGCPPGATPTVSLTTHNIPGPGTRILYKCGDTFTGGSSTGAVAKWSIGAYGSCQGTQSGLPTITGTITVTSVNAVGGAVASDGRISDLNGATGASAMVISQPFYIPPTTAVSQITFWNLMDTAVGNTALYSNMGTQIGIIQADFVGMGTQQQTYLNVAENNCLNGSNTWAGCAGAFVNLDYQAILGSHFDGVGGSGGGGVETVRVSACRMCVFANSDFLNANTVGSTFKLNDGNNKNTQCQWTGNWIEYVEMSDNFYGGQSGAAIADWVAENPVTDERLRFLIAERNVFAPGASGKVLYFGVMNGTLRNNAFLNSGVQSGNRGAQGSSFTDAGCTSGSSGAPTFPLFPQGVEIYNNTFQGSSSVIFGGGGFGGPMNNSFVKNNLIFSASTISSSGSGNAVGNNTTTTTNNPGFTNGSGTLHVISDYKPTAFFTLTNTPVPVWYDALGVAWSPTWDLGAVHH